MNATTLVHIGHHRTKRGSTGRSKILCAPDDYSKIIRFTEAFWSPCIYCSHTFKNWPIPWLSGLVVRFEKNTDQQFVNVNDSYYFYTPLLSPAYLTIFTTQSHIILDDFKHKAQNFPQELRRPLPPSSLITLDGDSSFTTIPRLPDNSHPLLQFQ